MASSEAVNLYQFRKQQTERKRASVLKAGLEVFLDVGFSNAAVMVIADKAEVSTATLYKYFSSKEVLFEEVIRAAYAEIEDGADPVVDGDAEGVIFTFLKNSVSRYSSHNFNDLLRIAWSEVPASAELAREFFEQQLQKRHAELRELLDMLVLRGDLAIHNTDIGARQISGMVKEALVWPGLYKAQHDLPENADEIISQAIETYFARFFKKASAESAPDGRISGLRSEHLAMTSA